MKRPSKLTEENRRLVAALEKSRMSASGVAEAAEPPRPGAVVRAVPRLRRRGGLEPTRRIRAARRLRGSGSPRSRRSPHRPSGSGWRRASGAQGIPPGLLGSRTTTALDGVLSVVREPRPRSRHSSGLARSTCASSRPPVAFVFLQRRAGPDQTEHRGTLRQVTEASTFPAAWASPGGDLGGRSEATRVASGATTGRHPRRVPGSSPDRSARAREGIDEHASSRSSRDPVKRSTTGRSRWRCTAPTSITR